MAQDEVPIGFQIPGHGLSRYRFQKFLSSGRSGKVMQCQNSRGSVVIKSMSKRSVRKEWVENEMKAGLLLRHKGIVKFKEYFEDDSHYFICLEMVKGDDMWQWMQDRNWKPLTEREARGIFKQVAKSVEHCHFLGIAHKDIKLENVMIDRRLKTTLLDFGFCEFAFMTKLSMRYDGTLDYMSPEELLRVPFSPYKADMFALGVFLFILLTGLYPFDVKTRFRELEAGIIPMVDWSSEGIPGNLSEEVKDLISKLLDPDPEKRLEMRLLSEHTWMKKRMSFDFWQGLPRIKA